MEEEQLNDILSACDNPQRYIRRFDAYMELDPESETWDNDFRNWFMGEYDEKEIEVNYKQPFELNAQISRAFSAGDLKSSNTSVLNTFQTFLNYISEHNGMKLTGENFDGELRGKEDVLPCIESGNVDERICAACANADYLTEEEKIFLLKSFLRRKTEADRRMYEQIGFVWSPQIPYQSCVSYLLEHEPLTEEYLLYLLMKDSESPNESFIHNFQILLNDRNLSDTVKIGYYLCLPNLGRRRDTTKRLKKSDYNTSGF